MKQLSERVKITAYRKGEIDQRIRDKRKDGYVVHSRGSVNADGTRCWAVLVKPD